MRPTVKQTLVYGVIALGLLLLVPGSYVAYLYLTYIDETVTSGSAYGFSIGQSKLEAYQVARDKCRSREIAGIEASLDQDEELRLNPWLADEFHALEEVRDQFDQWNHWGVWLTAGKPALLTIIRWRGAVVSGVGAPGVPGDRWQPEKGLAPLSIEAGDSYEEVYATLETLARTPGYENLGVRTGWMAKRQPVECAEEEFRFVESHDYWTLLVGKERGYFNSIRLTFGDDNLVEIYRHRGPELP